MLCDMNIRILICDLFKSSVESCLNFINAFSNTYTCSFSLIESAFLCLGPYSIAGHVFPPAFLATLVALHFTPVSR